MTTCFFSSDCIYCISNNSKLSKIIRNAFFSSPFLLYGFLWLWSSAFEISFFTTVFFIKASDALSMRFSANWYAKLAEVLLALFTVIHGFEGDSKDFSTHVQGVSLSFTGRAIRTWTKAIAFTGSHTSVFTTLMMLTRSTARFAKSQILKRLIVWRRTSQADVHLLLGLRSIQSRT